MKGGFLREAAISSCLLCVNWGMLNLRGTKSFKHHFTPFFGKFSKRSLFEYVLI